MNTQTLISASPDDLLALFSRAMAPMAEELAQLRAQVGQHRDVLTVPEIAQLTGFSAATIRDWIKDGRPVPGKTRREYLRVIDGLAEGPHRIRRTEYERFMALFPDVRAR